MFLKYSDFFVSCDHILQEFLNEKQSDKVNYLESNNRKSNCIQILNTNIYLVVQIYFPVMFIFIARQK